MFNRWLREGILPNSWGNASVVIIHKKVDTAGSHSRRKKNYRPISLLPITCKVFFQVILRRMLRTLDQHQPSEQAGFRSGFSTIDHIQVISHLHKMRTNIRSRSASPPKTMRKHLTPSNSTLSLTHQRTRDSKRPA